MNIIDVTIQVEAEEFTPFYASAGAAGADVMAFIQEDLTIAPGESLLVSTGVRVAIPEGYEIQVRPRSGLAAKNQITVLNSPGTIDADYRGEIKVILMNHGKTPFVITRGMRIAQLVLAPVVRAAFIKGEPLVATGRGEGGFGHTGT